jgi:hypothetical protein
MKNIIELTVSHRGGGKSAIFSGRSEGEEVRKSLNLDTIDSDGKLYKIVIPSDTISFNPSFFLGLLFPSIKKMGGVEKFNKKYEFDYSKLSVETRPMIEDDIIDGLRSANNELNLSNGLKL